MGSSMRLTGKKSALPVWCVCVCGGDICVCGGGEYVWGAHTATSHDTTWSASHTVWQAAQHAEKLEARVVLGVGGQDVVSWQDVAQPFLTGASHDDLCVGGGCVCVAS